MSESTAGAGDVTEPPAENETAEPGPPAKDETAEPGPPAEDETTEPGPPAKGETVEEAIARLEAESKKAREEKEAADSRFTDVDGRLTALRNLQRDIDKAMLAYKSVRDQLKIDQQAYLDYQESEQESLEKQLKPEGVGEVKKKSQAKKS